MQCAVVLRVGITIKQNKTEHLGNLLILLSFSQMYLHEYKINFSEHKKI